MSRACIRTFPPQQLPRIELRQQTWASSLASYEIPNATESQLLTVGPRQLGGFAFTSSVLYVTVHVHRSTRIAQRKAIREQVDQIDWLVSSSGAYDRHNLPVDIPRRRREELEAQKQAEPTMKEILKQRWNTEVENLTRKAYETRWQDIRDATADGWKAATQIIKRE